VTEPRPFDPAGETGQVIAAVLADMASPGHRGIIVDSPPGAGKSTLVVQAAATLAAGGEPCIIVAQTNNQVDDLAGRLAAHDPGLRIGRLSATDYAPGPGLLAIPAVTVATSVDDLPDADVIIGTAAKWARVRDRHWTWAIMDEAYQMRSDMLLPIAARSDRAVFVGDPGQLDPFSVIETTRWLGLPWDPMRSAMAVVLTNNPDLPVHRLPVSWRLPYTAAGEQIPADVARYGEQMHANTAALLRQSLTDDPAEFAGTLARMFDGHDVIAESPEGQAFRAFTNLVGMPSQRTQLETDISEILTRVRRLPPHLAETLGSFIDMMWQRVQEVEGVRKGAFRRMNNFVRGGDALHYRSMRTRVTEAQASAAEAFRVAHGGRDIGFAVPLAGIVTMSVGRLRLDEGTAGPPDPVTDSSDEFIIDPAALTGQESIDWGALRAAAHEALEAHGGFATLPEVLAQLRDPRTGDVIGIWALATRHGEVDETSRETVRARTSRGLRELTVPYLVFGDQLPDPIAAARRRPPLGSQPLLTAVDIEGQSR
jgi:Protein of unknown function (DUF3375)/AAA domain